MAKAKKSKPAVKAVKKLKKASSAIKKSGKKVVVKKKRVKSKKVSAVPKGYHSVTPYLIMRQCADAIEFYKKAFGAKEMMRMEKEVGKIGHAELTIGDSKIMLADEHLELNARGPQTVGGTPVSLYLYMKNVDAIFKQALEAGATEIRPVADQFYGDRSGGLQDPFGHIWYIATHVEDVTPAQIKKRLAEMAAQGQKPC